jgi:hypothetical protein
VSFALLDVTERVRVKRLPADPQHPRQLLATRAHRKPLRITNRAEAVTTPMPVQTTRRYSVEIASGMAIPCPASSASDHQRDPRRANQADEHGRP